MEAAGQRWIVHPSRSDVIKIWNLSDLHIINAACAVRDIERDVETIRNDPCSFWLGGGDYCDFIGYTDKRFDPDSVADWVSVQDLSRLGDVGYRRIRDMLYPIRHKCLGLLLGNHEKKYLQHKEQADRQAWLCQELELPANGNLGYCSIFDVLFVRASCAEPTCAWSRPKGVNRSKTQLKMRVFAHHGAGFAQTPGGKLNRLIQFMQSFNADLYFCGHVHDQVGRREPTLGCNADCSKITKHERLGLISGSYLKTYAQGVCTYGEQRGYRPTCLGAAWAEINPETGDMHGTI